MEDFVRIDELKATWSLAHSIACRSYCLLKGVEIRVNQSSSNQLDEGKIRIVQKALKKEQDICIEQAGSISGGNKKKIKRTSRLLKKEYHLLLKKLKQTKRSLNNQETRFIEGDLRLLKNIGSGFFFLWEKRIDKLTNRFCGYQHGPQLNREKVRKWLGQFKNELNMELALRCLNSIKFIRFEDIKLTYRKFYYDQLQHNKDQLVLVNFLSPLESTSIMSTNFVKALKECGKKFTRNDVIDFKKLLKANDYKNKICIIVEDFVGSGKQYHTAFNELLDINKKSYKYFPKEMRLNKTERQKFRDVQGFFLVHITLKRGFAKVGSLLRTHCPSLSLINLSRRHPKKCLKDNRNFNNRKIFDSFKQAHEAKELCTQIGFQLLSKKYPDEKERSDHVLGFEDSQQLVVFSHTCPNNTLPIFWKDGLYQNEPWESLFPKPGERNLR